MKKTISLFTAVFIIVGYIVGATIYILPGELTAIVGPGVFIAYLIAAVPAILFCFIIALLGSALPTTGASLKIIGETFSPFYAFIYLWVMLALGAVVLPLIAYGFSHYFSLFFPLLDQKQIAFSVIAFFVLVNCFGVGVSGVLQNVMVLFFLVGLMMFGGVGVAQGNSSLLTPVAPLGGSSLLVGAATAYFSYAGVMVVAEIAGEIKNPGKNIPLAILIGFSIVVSLYVLVPFALVQVIPWQQLSEDKTPIITAANLLFPPVLVKLILTGALLAAATSVNGIIMGLSRDVYQGAVEGLFPRILTKTGSRFNAPIFSVLVVGVLASLGMLSGGNLTDYAQIAVLGILLSQILISIAVYRLPRVLPNLYAESPFQLSSRALAFLSVSSVLVSLLFMYLIVASSYSFGVYGLAYLAIGALSYFFCKWFNLISKYSETHFRSER